MKAMNRSMPPSTIIPVLGYADVREGVAWLCNAFGFVERLRIGDHRAQLTFGDGSIVVTGLPPDTAPSGVGSPRSIMVRVSDVDAHFTQARQTGAEVLSPPTDFPYGERQYSALDLGGHAWTFSQSISDVDPGTWGGELVG